MENGYLGRAIRFRTRPGTRTEVHALQSVGARPEQLPPGAWGWQRGFCRPMSGWTFERHDLNVLRGSRLPPTKRSAARRHDWAVAGATRTSEAMKIRSRLGLDKPLRRSGCSPSEGHRTWKVLISSLEIAAAESLRKLVPRAVWLSRRIHTQGGEDRRLSPQQEVDERMRRGPARPVVPGGGVPECIRLACSGIGYWP